MEDDVESARLGVVFEIVVDSVLFTFMVYCIPRVGMRGSALEDFSKNLGRARPYTDM